MLYRKPGELVRPIGLVLLCTLVLPVAGCADEPTPTIAAGPPASTVPTGAPPTANPTFGDQTRNTRNNLVKSVGQPGAVTNEGGEPVLEFRVDAIRQNADCAADGYSDVPENGQFLAVDLFARTTPDYDTQSSDTGIFSAYSWTVVTADGVRHVVDTGPAFGCSPRSGQNLGNLTPGITVSGTFLLDAPTDLTGAVLVLQSALTEGGWEWPVPAV